MYDLLEAVAFVRAELAARRTTPSEMARAIGVNERTLRNQLNGENALTRANARSLREALDEDPRWHDLRARDVLVTLGRRLTKEEAGNLHPGLVRNPPVPVAYRIQPLPTVPSWVDTVVLNLEVPPENRDAVEALIFGARSYGTGPDIGVRCEHQRVLFRSKASGVQSGGSLIVAWAPYSRRSTFWCRVQFHPGLSGQLPFVRDLRAAAHEGYVRPDSPGVSVARLDPFVDIGLPVGSFFASRLRARRYRYVESEGDGETLYVGSPQSVSLLRCYDAVAKHGLRCAHPVTRLEMQLQPRQPLPLWSQELEKFGASHLSNIRLHACHVPAATASEMGLLRLARHDGVAYVRKLLRRESPVELARFDDLLERAAQALPIFDIADHLQRAWPLALCQLRDALRCDWS